MKPRLVSFAGFYAENHCFVWPAFWIIAQYCDNEHCGAVHGFSFYMQWLWWGFEVNVGPHMIGEE